MFDSTGILPIELINIVPTIEAEAFVFPNELAFLKEKTYKIS